MDRFVYKECESASELIKKVEGINIGSGLRKIIAGVLGGPDGCEVLVHAVVESATAVILHFTRPGLQLGESLTADEQLAGTQAMLQSNPRLIRSCVSFQDESPLMQGLNLRGEYDDII